MRDLLGALGQAGDSEGVATVRAHLDRFSHVTEVRRAVTELADYLQAFREDGRASSASAAVVIAANRLEDACRNALRGGVIVAAKPSVLSQLQRKFLLILWAVVGGLALLAIPTLFLASGKSVEDFKEPPALGPFSVQRGQRAVLPIGAPVLAKFPKAVTALRLRLEEDCDTPLNSQGLTCSELPARWRLRADGPTYEVRHADRPFGLVFAFGQSVVHQGRGVHSLHVSARRDTPAGRYTLRFQPAYVGYGPDADCVPPLRWLGLCDDGPGQGRVDDRMAVVTVLVDVTTAPPGSTTAAAQAVFGETAPSMAVAPVAGPPDVSAELAGIRQALRKTRRLVKKRSFVQASQPIAEVQRQLEALELLAQRFPEQSLLGEDFEELRVEWSKQQTKLVKFERRLFERWFKAAHGGRGGALDPDTAVRRVAKDKRVPEAFLTQVVTVRSDETARRLEERKRLRDGEQDKQRQALIDRCGSLPTGSWSAISEYLNGQYPDPKVTVEVSNCLTPRLSKQSCWLVECDYRRTTLRLSGSRHVAKLRATFNLRDGRVMGLQSR